MKKQNGGKRKGAGRPIGALSKKNKELQIQVMEEGITPLQVLINDMRFYYNLGEQEFLKIRGKELLEESYVIFKVAHGLKNTARECAIMAAPYIHPKLASIDAKIAVSNHETALAELE